MNNEIEILNLDHGKVWFLSSNENKIHLKNNTNFSSVNSIKIL